MDYNNEIDNLQDTKRNGKPVNWRGRKIGAWHLQRSYQRLGMDSKAARTFMCAQYLDFREYDDGKLKFHRSRFCMDKLCPMCATRRSEKLNTQMNRVIDYISEREKYRYVFLTLTIKNMPGEELSQAIDDIFYGFNLLTKRKEFKRMSKGWMRALEVTHNWKEDTYHPHIHMVIAVDDAYFSEFENYINHDEWLRMWKSCMRLNYDPWVDIRKVKKDRITDEEKKSNTVISYKHAIAEITKYTTKSADYLVRFKDKDYFEKKHEVSLKDAQHAYELTDKAVSTLTDALYNRRLIAYGGEIRKVHKLLHLTDVETGDLNPDDGEAKQVTTEYTVIRFKWNNRIKDYLRDWSYSERSTVDQYGNVLVERGP